MTDKDFNERRDRIVDDCYQGRISLEEARVLLADLRDELMGHKAKGKA